MYIKFALCLLMMLTASPLWAKDTRVIVIADTPITVPVPGGFKDVSAEKGTPDSEALFAKAEPEPWEETGEVFDYILVYGLGLKPTSEAIKQQKFDTIADAVKSRIQARIYGKLDDETDAAPTPTPKTNSSKPEPLLAEEIFAAIMRNSTGSRAYALETTANRKHRKAFLIDTSFEMPGVFTFPIIEEISFVRVGDRMIIAHVVALDVSKLQDDRLPDVDVRARVKATSVEIRKGLLKRNR